MLGVAQCGGAARGHDLGLEPVRLDFLGEVLGDVKRDLLDAFGGLRDALLVGVAAPDLGARRFGFVSEQRLEQPVERLRAFDMQIG